MRSPGFGSKAAWVPPKYSGPLWPMAYSLGLHGFPLACWLQVVAGFGRVVVVDERGELWILKVLPLAWAVHWCVSRNLVVFGSLGELCDALDSGSYCGWILGAVHEYQRNGAVVRIQVLPYDAGLGAEAAGVLDDVELEVD